MNHIYSVKQVNAYVKNMFQQDFLLNRISVRGEVSNYKAHPSGHIYFTLKDADGVLSVVMFAGSRSGLKCQLREGMKAVVTGSINVYEAGGRYQLYAKRIESDGEGDLYKAFLELKEKLSDMGIFDEEYKKPVPRYARTVGIVTASSGAALQDICQISHRRNPYVQLILCPAQVQGDGAAESIVRAIERLDAIHPDVMIVGRGGGSIEDLWCFNDERVAMAIFNADTPIISAVGHEVDFTIADFAADHRAPTPSAAAELAVFDLDQYLYLLKGALQRMEELCEKKVHDDRRLLQSLWLRLKLNHPENRLNEKRQYLADCYSRMEKRVSEIFEKRKRDLLVLSERLEGRSPLLRLKDGYGYLETDGKPLRSISDVSEGSILQITLHDGVVESEVRKAVKRFGREESRN